jgi:hypothetical protein
MEAVLKEYECEVEQIGLWMGFSTRCTDQAVMPAPCTIKLPQPTAVAMNAPSNPHRCAQPSMVEKIPSRERRRHH